jgi:hypothetical protein
MYGFFRGGMCIGQPVIEITQIVWFKIIVCSSFDNAVYGSIPPHRRWHSETSAPGQAGAQDDIDVSLDGSAAVLEVGGAILEVVSAARVGGAAALKIGGAILEVVSAAQDGGAAALEIGGAALKIVDTPL